MIYFVLTCLAVFVVAFLVMLTVQLIRMERKLSDLTDYVECHVKKIYGKD